MTLHIVYRSYGGENRKSRPPYYSKRLALLSFLRALDKVEAEVIFLNDGPIPADLLELMESAGEVVSLSSAGLRGSYVAALRLALDRPWGRRDVVHYSEDDYLYHPDALVQLRLAAEQLPQVDYFALYGSTPERPVYPPEQHALSYPSGWRQRQSEDVKGWDWINIISTTSTFAGRVRALREDRWIFRQAMLPMRRQFWDHETCLVYQGYQSFPWPRLLQEGLLRSSGSLRERVRTAALSPFKAGINLRAYRRSSRRRLLYAADPNLATHLELPHIAPGVDWQAVAKDTHEWAVSSGFDRQSSGLSTLRQHEGPLGQGGNGQ